MPIERPKAHFIQPMDLRNVLTSVKDKVMPSKPKEDKKKTREKEDQEKKDIFQVSLRRTTVKRTDSKDKDQPTLPTVTLKQLEKEKKIKEDKKSLLLEKEEKNLEISRKEEEKIPKLEKGKKTKLEEKPKPLEPKKTEKKQSKKEEPKIESKKIKQEIIQKPKPETRIEPVPKTTEKPPLGIKVPQVPPKLPLPTQLKQREKIKSSLQSLIEDEVVSDYSESRMDISQMSQPSSMTQSFTRPSKSSEKENLGAAPLRKSASSSQFVPPLPPTLQEQV